MEMAKRPRVYIGGHCDSVGPVMTVGTHQYEFDEYTALYWVNVLHSYLWHKMRIHTPMPPTREFDGDE